MGPSHTCALTSAGGVKCWGANRVGQLGNGTTTGSSTPVDVVGLSGVASISAGAEYSCALTTTGGVKCWGGPNVVPVDIVGLSTGVTAVSIDVSQSGACAVTNGGVKCWDLTKPDPVDYPGLTGGVSAIAIGHTTGTPWICVLTSAAGVMCLSSSTGVGFTEVVGITSPAPEGQTQPSAAPNSSGNTRAITAGSGHTCVLSNEGGVKCWGQNEAGQLGNGSTSRNSNTPVDVLGLTSGVVAIDAGSGFTCALTSAQGVKCWGLNDLGQLGNGTTANSLIPVDVLGLASGVKAIVAGDRRACALANTGGVTCWGLENAAGTNNLEPVGVAGLSSGVLAVAVGDGQTCALINSGGATCLGNGVGTGQATYSLTPVAVAGLAGGVEIGAGISHTCVLTSGGGVKCWGDNHAAQLGFVVTSAFLESLTPVDVPGLTSQVTAIAVGEYHTCALTSGGGVKCWGANARGQLGNGTILPSPTDGPLDVSGLGTGIAAVAAGTDHSCAVTVTGGVKCWGDNSLGALGSPSSVATTTTPVDVEGL